jgi:hypothetical protein
LPRGLQRGRRRERIAGSSNRHGDGHDALALAASVVSAAPADPFRGVWKSIDNDGGNQTVAFGGSGESRSVRYFDDGASACRWPDEPVSATLTGVGTISASSLTVDLSGTCHPGGGSIVALVTFTAVGDSLEDTLGVTWYRPPGPPAE